MKQRLVKSVPRPLALATAIAVIAEKSKMLVYENTKKSLKLPGLIIASSTKALQSLEELLERSDFANKPQQTLYLNHFTMEEHQKKPLTVIVRIVYVETEDIPSALDGHFRSLVRLRTQPQASSLVRTVAQWITEQ